MPSTALLPGVALPPPRRMRTRSAHSSSYSPATCYPGFLRVPLSDCFTDCERRLLDQLRAVAGSSLHALRTSAEQPVSVRRRATDIQWLRVRGNPTDDDHLALWETTIPSPDLSCSQLQLLHRRATSTVRPPREHAAGHFSAAQAASRDLAAAILRLCARLGAEVPCGVHFMAAQLTSSPAGSVRERHVDPYPIARLLLTLTLEGSAQILVEAGAATPQACITCDGSHAYLLTGASLLDPIHHSVKVSPHSRRLSVTFRFGASA